MQPKRKRKPKPKHENKNHLKQATLSTEKTSSSFEQVKESINLEMKKKKPEITTP